MFSFRLFSVIEVFELDLKYKNIFKNTILIFLANLYFISGRCILLCNWTEDTLKIPTSIFCVISSIIFGRSWKDSFVSFV